MIQKFYIVALGGAREKQEIRWNQALISLIIFVWVQGGFVHTIRIFGTFSQAFYGRHYFIGFFAKDTSFNIR